MTHPLLHLNRRFVLKAGTGLAAALALPSGTAFAGSGPNATVLMQYEGRKVGLKITPREDGSSIVTAREIDGEKLFVRKLSPRKDASGTASASFKGADGKSYSVSQTREDAFGFSSDMPGLKISAKGFFEAWPTKWFKDPKAAGDMETKGIANGDLGSGRSGGDKGFQTWLGMNKNDLIGYLARGAEFLSSGHSSGFINDGTEPLVIDKSLWY